MNEKKALATMFLMAIIILLILGLAMNASTSFTLGKSQFGSYYYFFKRQTVFVIMGIILFLFFSHYDYKKFQQKRIFIYFLGLIALISVLLFGKEVKGAKRWLDFFGLVSIQPSEFAKITLIIYLAGSLEYWQRKRLSFLALCINSLLPTLLYIFLIVMEKAYTNTMHLLIAALIMLFVSNINLFVLLCTTFTIVGSSSIFVLLSPYRRQRIVDYLHGMKEINKMGYQAKQALIAVGNGNLFGRGYGEGFQKYTFLPEIHTDYIFAGYAEEFGFAGCIFLLLIYFIIIFVMIRVIVKTKNLYGKFLMTGILSLFSIQIILNIGVVLAILPSTGIPLPLMTYGGSSTIATMIILGITFNFIKKLE